MNIYKIFFIILIIFIVFLIIQEIYKHIIYFIILKNFKNFNKSTKKYNKYVENLYYKSLKRNNENDFGQYYDKVNYDFFEISSTHNAGIIKKSILTESPYLFDYTVSNIKDGDTILDCGCGTGGFSIYIASKLPNINIICITNSYKCLYLTKKKIKENNLGNRIKAYLLNYDNLLQNTYIIHTKFDKIFFLESHGYSKNRILLLKNCYNLLKKKGLLYIRTPTFSDIRRTNFKHIVNFWKYNFSTTNNICLDLDDIGFNVIKYTEINEFALIASYDVSILIRFFLFLLTNSVFFKLIKTHAYPMLLIDARYTVIKALHP